MSAVVSVAIGLGGIVLALSMTFTWGMLGGCFGGLGTVLTKLFIFDFPWLHGRSSWATGDCNTGSG